MSKRTLVETILRYLKVMSQRPVARLPVWLDFLFVYLSQA